MKAVEYTKAAVKALRKMPKKDREVLMDKMDEYAAKGTGDVKRLQDSDLLRLRHGDWRAIFSEDGTVIAVLNVAHRREVYR